MNHLTPTYILICYYHWNNIRNLGKIWFLSKPKLWYQGKKKATAGPRTLISRLSLSLSLSLPLALSSPSSWMLQPQQPPPLWHQPQHPRCSHLLHFTPSCSHHKRGSSHAPSPAAPAHPTLKGQILHPVAATFCILSTSATAAPPVGIASCSLHAHTSSSLLAAPLWQPSSPWCLWQPATSHSNATTVPSPLPSRVQPHITTRHPALTTCKFLLRLGSDIPLADCKVSFHLRTY